MKRTIVAEIAHGLLDLERECLVLGQAGLAHGL